MSTLTQVVAGLGTVLRTLPALDNTVLEVVRRPSTFPAAVIVPPTIPDYGEDLADGGASFTLPVLLVVSTTVAENQQTLWPLLDWSGASSIKAAVAADRTLGGLDVDARVASLEDPGLVDFGDGGTLGYGVTLNVAVIVTS